MKVGIIISLVAIFFALLFLFNPDLLTPAFMVSGIIIILALGFIVVFLIAGNIIDTSKSWDPVKAELPKRLRRKSDDDILAFMSSGGKKVNHGTVKDCLG